MVLAVEPRSSKTEAPAPAKELVGVRESVEREADAGNIDREAVEAAREVLGSMGTSEV